ncbi:Polyvinylalcohol dehydrogenase [Vitis vinifera]|uniref:Polyvinylalcohol dehydrogenase n=1 Tax=Vitis vinifera TaxID=29760 RepID=A0A438HDT8_VITVI|nr:Polyvinylalcohol dehydrogenase [Vitis vinifera]
MLCLLTITACADSRWDGMSDKFSQKEPAEWLNHGGDLARHNCYTSNLQWYPYFPSWNGYLYAVKASDGSLVWKQNLQKLTGLNATGFVNNVNWTVSRATPTIAGDMLIIGIYGPAVVIALKQATGRLVWSTQLDSNPAGVVTMSGTFHMGSFYVGTSSLEEGLSIEQCCIFRGSLSKLDIKTGALLWQTFTLPDNHGERGEYAGAAIWGSSPSIDVRRNLVYVATDSDKIKWYRQLGGYDVWFLACNNLSTPNCPPGPNPDADFGEAPMMLSIYVNGTMRDIVTAVQKSGFAWALDRNNGSLVWATVMMKEAGPGGLSGGGTWGAATDGIRVYTNIVNSDSKNFTLKPSEKNTTAGGWVAIEAGTGKILWSTANPSNATSNGPVTIANGVLFAGSTHATGLVYAMDAASGKILWSHNTGATVFGGASVSSGCIYVGSGYHVNIGSFFPFTSGTSLFAFCVA